MKMKLHAGFTPHHNVFLLRTWGWRKHIKQNVQCPGRGIGSAGFTLVEMLLSVFLMGLVIVGILGFAIYYFQSSSFSFEELQEVNQAQSGLTIMIREIREARISEAGGWPIVQADNNTFIFYSDVTNDGRSDRVRYFIENGELKKGVIEPTLPPVSYPSANEQIKTIVYSLDNGASSLFTYYNGSWPADTVNNPLPQTSRLLNTRYVSVYLRINVNPTSGAQPVELRSGVAIRSLKDNL